MFDSGMSPWRLCSYQFEFTPTVALSRSRFDLSTRVGRYQVPSGLEGILHRLAQVP
jgi:hypothetical protein